MSGLTIYCSFLLVKLTVRTIVIVMYRTSKSENFKVKREEILSFLQLRSVHTTLLIYFVPYTHLVHLVFMNLFKLYYSLAGRLFSWIKISLFQLYNVNSRYIFTLHLYGWTVPSLHLVHCKRESLCVDLITLKRFKGR